MASDSNERQIRFARWALGDALDAAINIAARASELFSGTEEAILFDRVRHDIHALKDDNPSMKAIAAHSVRSLR